MLKGQGASRDVGSSAKRPPEFVRRSARLEALKKPPPSPEYEQTDKSKNKRRRVLHRLNPNHPTRPLKPKSEQTDTVYGNARLKTPDQQQANALVADKHSHLDPYNPIAHWAQTCTWPPDFRQHGLGMSEQGSSKRRRSSSGHRSEVVERLSRYGIFMYGEPKISSEGKDLCDSYLVGEREIAETSIFNWDEFDIVLGRVSFQNEDRIQRDVMPWVVPSAESLIIRGKLTRSLAWIGEEVGAEWNRCATLGSTKPKPDYAAGLRRAAFSDEEIAKLENYASPTKPFHVTAELVFPFLICEAKNGENGLNKADRQNIHSASIAVNAMLQLYKEAFGAIDPKRITALSDQVLVFTISHSNDLVFLFGHFATFNTASLDGLAFYRHPIAVYSLTANSAMDRLKSYNFVVNIYEKFAETHRERIKAAVAHLPIPMPRVGSVASIPTNTEATDNAFKTPGGSTNVVQQNKLVELLEKQLEQLEKQIEQLRGDAAKRDEQQNKLIEQLREDAAKTREDAAKQMQLLLNRLGPK